MAKSSKQISRLLNAQPKSGEFAFYYPGHLWHSSDAIKNLLLYFDGVALLVPEYKQQEPLDDAVAYGLSENGMLVMLPPEQLVDREATETLASTLMPIFESGSLDKLASEPSNFAELSMSRFGFSGNEKLAKRLLKELTKRGLAEKSRDGKSIPMHPMVRYLVLVLLGQILRGRGADLGIELNPATDRQVILNSLIELLSLPTMPSASQVVSLDVETVGVDLSSYSIDEILKFKQDFGDDFRKYARDVRKTVFELSQLPRTERESRLADRSEELSELAQSLRRQGRLAWKSYASFSLGIAGAVWSVKSGDIEGGLFALGAGLLGADFLAEPNAGAYSYLFSARSALY